jgi:hypothetical protein
VFQKKSQCCRKTGFLVTIAVPAPRIIGLETIKIAEREFGTPATFNFPFWVVHFVLDEGS